jgi:hypothetical protein
LASGFSRTPAITTLVSEPDTQFDAPRWSPDGRTIAVERHRPGSLSEVALVDVDSKTVRPIDGPERARMVTPTWRPDGRAVLVSVAAEDQPFNLVEFSVDGQALPRRLTHTTGGATWPDVSADGRTIVFVGYTVDGFDLFTMAYPSPGPESLASSVRPGPPKNERVAPVVSPPQSNRPTSSYSPLRTLWPTSWVPILEDDQSQDRVGARVFGSDVLGYHVYSADATWLTARPSDSLSPRSTFDWSAYYAYARWRPVFWVSAEKSTSFFAGQPDERGEPLPVTLHERQVETGVSFPMIHTRIAQRSQVSFVRAVDHYTMPDGSTSLDRAALRGAWSMGTAHTYGYSISPERGVVVGTTAEAVRTALGSDANATMLTTDLRLFAPMPASHHVLAVRAAAGTATGDPNIRRTFHLGGAGPDASVMSFNRDAISVLRGFPADRFAGSHVALLNVDYRFPIVRPQRGADTWPLFLHTVHAAAFADVGHAWTSNFRGRDMKTSIGGELSVDIVFGYFVPLTVSAGAARGHDGRGLERDRTTLYLRIGRAF